MFSVQGLVLGPIRLPTAISASPQRSQHSHELHNSRRLYRSGQRNKVQEVNEVGSKQFKFGAKQHQNKHGPISYAATSLLALCIDCLSSDVGCVAATCNAATCCCSSAISRSFAASCRCSSASCSEGGAGRAAPAAATAAAVPAKPPPSVCTASSLRGTRVGMARVRQCGPARQDAVQPRDPATSTDRRI